MKKKVFKNMLIALLLLAMVLQTCACGLFAGKGDDSASSSKRPGGGFSDDSSEKSGEDSSDAGPESSSVSIEDSLISAGYKKVDSAASQAFSTWVKEDYRVDWDDANGMEIYTDEEGYIPYVLIYRTLGSTGTKDTIQKLFDEDITPGMESKYGSDLKSVGKFQTFNYGNKTTYGVEYRYKVQEYIIVMLQVILPLKDSNISFIAKYIQGEGTDTMNALKDALLYLEVEGEDLESSGSSQSSQESSQQSSGSQSGEDSSKLGEYTVAAYTPETLQTVTVSKDVFTMEMPVGWVYSCVGAYQNFGIYVYDPNKPERKIFYFCKMEWLNKSTDARNYYQQLANSLYGDADPYGYRISAALPALDYGTTAEFWSVWPDFIGVHYQVNGYGFIYPDINNIYILDVLQNYTYTTPGCTDNSLLRAWFYTDDGTVGQGMFGAQVTNQITNYDPYSGLDLGTYCAYDVCGYTASVDDFPELEAVLLRCLASFDFTQSYVQQTIDHIEQETERILQQGRDMQKVYDSFNEAWSNRQTSYDIISQKNSDATLGYERLYDSVTGEVYRAEIGFYDTYNANRYSYSNPYLHKIDDKTEQYYLQTVDYYITK